MPDPTTATYVSFQQAYDYFNEELFGSQLPPCMITLRHKRKTLGYFYPERFKRRKELRFEDENASVAVAEPEAKSEEEAAIEAVESIFALAKKKVSIDSTCCEISLNATAFDRGDRDVLSTLVHEMCHLWQFYFGKMPSGGWHDREWGRKMAEVGLIPSNTGAPGGKMVGRQMSHYIDDEGAYDKAYWKLAGAGFRIEWGENPDAEVEKKVSRRNKVKYACPDCGLNAWGKPQIRLFCADCSENEDRNVVMDAVL